MEDDAKEDLKISLKEKPNPSNPEKEKRTDYDIYDNANFLSKLVFHWLAKSTKLSPSLLGTLSQKNDSTHYSEYIKHFWETEKYNSIPKNALMKTILRANRTRLIKALILSFICCGLQFFSILLLKEYIDYFQFPGESRFSLLELGITFLATQFLFLMINNHTNLNLAFMGFRAKYELNCFIYNKLLKVSPSSFNDKAGYGEIINFLQVDSNKLSALMLVSPNLITSPLMIIAYIYLLFDFFGLSFFTGVGIILFLFFIQFFLFKNYRVITRDMLTKTDYRMRLTTEVFDSIKILKMYNWENEFKQRIINAREEEVLIGKKRLILSTTNISLFCLCPVFVGIGTIGVYTFVNKTFDIATMLIGLALFARLQIPVRDIPWSINALLETFVSMARIERFINQKEYEESNVIIEDKNKKSYAIKIENGSFTWGKIPSNEDKKEQMKDETTEHNKDSHSSKYNQENENTENHNNMIEEPLINNTNDDIKDKILSSDQNDSLKALLPNSTIQSDQSKIEIQNKGKDDEKEDIEEVDKKDYEIVLNDINLEIKQGEAVGIIGEVGSGKTSLLQAILNSLILISKKKCDGIHIAGSVGYVSQIPWIQNDTIKNNIIFFNEFDAEKYQKVLEKSQLEHDLNNLEAKDQTEIGEKGINLSGGQKVRVSLARALYANPDIYLFDDPISALDANIGRNIIDDCIMKYLKGKTRLITTHALYFLKEMDKIIFLDKGKICWTGTYKELIKQEFFDTLIMTKKGRKDSSHKKSLDFNEEDNESEDDKDDHNPKDDKEQGVKKLMKDEDQEIGVVKLQVYIKYCIYMGGICFILMIVFVMFLWAFNKCGSDFWLSYWSMPNNQDPDSKMFFFLIYSGIGTAGAAFVFLRLLMLSLGCIKLSRSLHNDMITKLIKAPINLFHDIVPRGQLFNRLSKDLENLQFMILTVGNLLIGLFSVIGAIGICSIYDLYSLIFLPFFGIVGYLLIAFYLIGKRDLSRLERTSYSPILNTVSETIPGVISIKAFGKCQQYLNRFYRGVNDNFKVCVFYYGSETWFRFQFNLLSFLFVAYLVAYTNIFEESSSPQSVGMMFTYSVILQESLEGFFLYCAYLETQMVSMERCLTYTKTEEENPSIMPTDTYLIEKSWPQDGKIEFVDYSVRYRPNTELVLKNLSMTINPKEKIGVIGRTGSGKSTICLCLFRILEPLTGTIKIDDIDITEIGLDLLRQNITIIPQDPTLMQGTLKYNIDPFNRSNDSEILGILSEIGFNTDDNIDCLKKIIEEKGNNLSVGEKQLICIARAMLRKTKIIVMDEATANIDMKTEEKIQNALSMILQNSTILTIAHRIKTIIKYDRILVLDDGKVAELDTPENLLKNKSSLFYELYSKSSV